MMPDPRISFSVLTFALLTTLIGSPSFATTLIGSSEYVMLSCTSDPCPWGATLGSETVVWPDAVDGIDYRLGYTGEQAFSLAANDANSATVSITSGSVTLYAWVPTTLTQPQRTLATLNSGDSYTVENLAGGEVLTILGATSFGYEIELATAGEAEPMPETAPEPEPSETTTSETTTIDGFSRFITLDCEPGTLPCPFGSQLNTNAVVWPDWTQPIGYRLGYSGSNGASLPSAYGNGGTFRVVSGTVGLHAWRPNSDSQRLLGNLGPGQSYAIEDLEPGEVFTVLSPYSFRYEADLPAPPNPVEGDQRESVAAYWRCNVPECTTADWEGAVLDWPSWSAYSNNLRTGEGSRTTYGENGGVLYPYMGAWAHGCTVTVNTGTVWVIEWERGTDHWDLTTLGPGDSHTIVIEPPHDGALIEGFHGFAATVSNCTPQPVPQ